MKSVKRFIPVIAVVLGLAAVAGAKEPAGQVVGDTLFVDTRYGFSVPVLEGWKAAQIGKAEALRRVSFAERNPTLPAKFRDDPSLHTSPRLTILADTSALTADSLKSLLLGTDRKLPLVKKARVEFVFLAPDVEFPTDFGSAKVFKAGGFQGVVLTARKAYRYSVPQTSRLEAESFKQDYQAGLIWILKRGTTVLLIEAICEREVLGAKEAEFNQMVNSLAGTGTN